MRGASRSIVVLGPVVLLLLALVLAAYRYDRPNVKPGAWLEARGLEARFETIAGHRLRYVRVGDGPSVLLVHGFASSLYTWKDVLPALSTAHDVVALDLPGFGGSDRPVDLSFEDLPAAVLGLMDHLEIRSAALVGNSMGGGVVATVAARRPARVSALVLVDAAGFNLAREDQPALVRIVTSPLVSVMSRMPGRRLFVERALRQVFYDDSFVTEERVAEYLDGVRRPGSLVSQRSLMASFGGRTDLVTSQLPRIEAPTLVIWGREDQWIPPADAERFGAAIPRARVVLLDACGHLPQVERASEVSGLLLEFLSATGDREAATSSRE